MDQRFLDQRLMEQRLKQQRPSPQTEMRAVAAQQRLRPPGTLHAVTDISGPTSNQSLGSDHILSDPVLTEPLMSSLAQQTPPADTIFTDQSLDDIQETNTFADSFEGLFGDWDVRQPHNGANTPSPQNVSLIRPKDDTDGTTIEELKR